MMIRDNWGRVPVVPFGTIWDMLENCKNEIPI